MLVDAVIEIPRGDNVRRHISNDKKAFIDLGLIKDKIPVNNGVMPADYGFIPHTHNQADQDEIDIIVVTDCKLTVGELVSVKPIAIVNRDDGDHKIIATEEDNITSWETIPEEVRSLIGATLCYQHTFTLGSRQEAEEYITNRRATVNYQLEFRKHRH